ncbi:MAG: DNA polymerase IV [Planctomycetes bacterium]|nr:DNA polymerase IV [Planctomycetota bacterium]
MEPQAMRYILHIDMDAFYAAIEQRDRPELRGKPVLVGGSPEGRGVVSTASYEARPFGCHSAMPMAQALRLCPQAIVLPGRMERYIEVSRQIAAIFEEFTPLVEPLSIDEAFLDVGGSTRLFGPPVEIARELKARIHKGTHLTASVGVAPNKFLAKLASDLQKPDGLVVVPPDGVQGFLDPLPIARLWGAGKVTQRRFTELGVATFGDARRLSARQLRAHFGEVGEHFYQLLRGIDDRPVVPDREARSISHEHTFAVDCDDLEYLRAVLLDQMEHVVGRLRRHKLTARTVTLKIRRPDFKTITRRTTLAGPLDQTDTLWEAAAELFDAWAATPHPVRLLGVGVAQLAPRGGQQLTLFDQAESERRQRLDQIVDQIRERFGADSIKRGACPHEARDEPDTPSEGRP